MSDYSKYIWYNSNIIPWEEANTHVMSHVLHYGSGVFEGIKCYKTSRGPAIFRLEDHINRLLESAALYRMKVNISKEEIVETLIPKSLKTQLFKGIRDSFASEHGARMTAMHKATDNAKELRDQLKLTYNKARQAAITNEILDIVGGSEALNG